MRVEKLRAAPPLRPQSGKVLSELQLGTVYISADRSDFLLVLRFFPGVFFRLSPRAEWRSLFPAGTAAGKGARAMPAIRHRLCPCRGALGHPPPPPLYLHPDPSDCVARSSPRRARQGAEMGLWLRLVFWDYGEGPAGQSTLSEREHQLDQHTTRGAPTTRAIRNDARRTRANPWMPGVKTGSTTGRDWRATAGRAQGRAPTPTGGGGSARRCWGRGHVPAAMVRGTGWGARGRLWVGVLVGAYL
jgi:hypothetical protein